MKKLIGLGLALFAAPVMGNTTATTTGLIEIRPNYTLYVEHYPADPGKPTLFMANGLTFSTRDYGALVDALKKADPGVGIVLWDMRGMGRTLLAHAPANYLIPVESQVQDIHDLKEKLGVKGPATLAGLSYGGAVALKYSMIYPDDFDHFVPISPMLERLPEQDMWIRSMANWHIAYASVLPFSLPYYIGQLQQRTVQNMVSWHQMVFPKETRNKAELTEYYQKVFSAFKFLQDSLQPRNWPNPANYEEVYDFYLRILIYSTYWIPEPTVLENPYKLEGVFRMVQGVKNWNAFDAASELPAKKIFAFAAVEDEHVKIDRMDLFWQKIPKFSRAGYLRVHNSRHKITTQWPIFSASWLLRVLNNDPELERGLTFEADPLKGEGCESLLRAAQ